ASARKARPARSSRRGGATTGATWASTPPAGRSGAGMRSGGPARPPGAGGRSGYGGDVVVTPRGGLIGCGHPLGATGVAQAAEVFTQLRGEAGARQVAGAAVGLTHNNSGMGEHVVMIYGAEPA